MRRGYLRLAPQQQPTIWQSLGNTLTGDIVNRPRSMSLSNSPVATIVTQELLVRRRYKSQSEAQQGFCSGAQKAASTEKWRSAAAKLPMELTKNTEI